MKELYGNMGFRENPFSRYSAEEEREYLQKIFVQPKYYPTIHYDIKSGSSRFIFGERGVGKSALVFNLLEDYSKQHVFSILIDDYEGIKKSNNGKEMLLLALQQLVTTFSLFLLKNQDLIKKFDKGEKEKLALFVNSFFITLSHSEFEKLYDKATHIMTKNILKRIFNRVLLKPTNLALNGCSEFVGQTINKALGLSTQLDLSSYREYIPELKETPVEEKLLFSDLSYKAVKTMLIETATLIKKCGFVGVVVIFDKIDEYRILGTQLSNIAEFSKQIILDTALLLDGRISFVFSFWSRIKQLLSDLGVRYDKLKPIDITWTDAELKRIIDGRLSYFSDKKVQCLENIIPGEYINSIYDLSQQSPRHMIILLSKIYDEQATTDETVTIFTKEAIEKGLANFAMSFDFCAFYAGVKPETMRKTVQEIVKVHKNEFETRDLISAFKISTQAANNKIRTMQDYGLIKDITAGTRAKRYKIVEPRISYIISNNLPY